MIEDIKRLLSALVVLFFLTILLMGTVVALKYNPSLFEEKKVAVVAGVTTPSPWIAPDIKTLPKTKENELIHYGHDLIEKTSDYLGPQGSVMQISNGMNCQNCHLEAGTKPGGNNFGAVASLYPRFRERSRTRESIERRIDDCFERSLNGKPLDSLSKEMHAMVAYIKWLGKDVPKGTTPEGAGLLELRWLDRAADPQAGKLLYLKKCMTCHGANGEGQRLKAGARFIYPPLWGENSFNTAAGLYRIGSFGRFIRINMPYGTSYGTPALSEDEAWDIAAYVISMPRPEKKFKQDWPKIETKPVDHPFGPYADKFSEQQHKYGPFKEIIEASKK